MSEFDLDLLRAERAGLEEALFCAGKTDGQILRIVETVAAAGRSMLLTRLDSSRHAAFGEAVRALLDYEPVSRTAFLGKPRPVAKPREPSGTTARRCRSSTTWESPGFIASSTASRTFALTR